LNISVQAANLSDCRIESNRKKIDSVAIIESNGIETFFARIGMLYGRDALIPFFDSVNGVARYFRQGVRQSVAILSVHSRNSAALPSRPYNQKNVMTYHTA